MDEKAYEAFVRLSDPGNDFMKQVAYGGDTGLAMLQKRALWDSIEQKFKQNVGDSNAFLNSLTVDELTLFLKETPAVRDDDGNSLLSQTDYVDMAEAAKHLSVFG